MKKKVERTLSLEMTVHVSYFTKLILFTMYIPNKTLPSLCSTYAHFPEMKFFKMYCEKFALYKELVCA